LRRFPLPTPAQLRSRGDQGSGRSPRFRLGTQGRRRQLLKKLRQRHQVDAGTPRCTAALHRRSGSGIGPGDEVIVPSFTWVPRPTAGSTRGPAPSSATSTRPTFNLNTEALSAAVTTRTRAIVACICWAGPRHAGRVAGRPRHKLAVIEMPPARSLDVPGAPRRRPGGAGLFLVPPAQGDNHRRGGMVTTTPPTSPNRVAALRNHGRIASRPGRPQTLSHGAFEFLGYNLRLSDIQAARSAWRNWPSLKACSNTGAASPRLPGTSQGHRPGCVCRTSRPAPAIRTSRL